MNAWEPGDPLYPRAAYRDYLFNFRAEPEGEVCMCPDATRWPDPHGKFALTDRDEISDFIAWYHANPGGRR